MKKIIIFTIMAIITFSWFITHYISEPEKDLPTNIPFIIKSNLPGICRISIMATTTDTKQNINVVACKVLLSTSY